MTSKHHRLLLGCLIAGLLLSQGCSEDNAPAKETAPDFSVPLFDGKSFQLGAYRGKPVLINFLASWCMPCREEIPILNQVYGEYTRDVAFIAIAVGDTEENAKQFVEEFSLSFPQVLIEPERSKKPMAYTVCPPLFLSTKKGLSAIATREA